MSKHLIVYRDGTDIGPGDLAQRINNMCGIVVENPRRDLRGNFIITDITSVQIFPNPPGWSAVAVVEIVPERFNMPLAAAEVGMLSPTDELFSKESVPPLPGDF